MWINEEDKGNELKNGVQAQITNPSIGAGGGGASTAPGTGNSSNVITTPTNASGPKPSQDFATIQDYLKTNQPQAEQLGQQFTGNLNTSLGNEKGAIDTAATQTKNDINAGTTNYNADLTNTALTDPTKVTNDPNQLQNFLKQWNASYSGPSSFEASTNYTPAITAANEAGQKSVELGTEGGQQNLIGEQFGVQGQGNKQLDQALLSSSSYNPQVQTQAKNFGTVQDYLANQAQNLDTTASNAQAATDAAKTQTQGAFANNLTNFQQGINAKVAANQAAATTQANTYSDALKSGDATKITNALQSSNLTDAQRNNLTDYLTTINKDYGSTPDLSKFYTANPATDVNAANSASAQDYANAAAYGKLTGTDYSGVLNPANAAQAGQLPNMNGAINATGADQALRQYLIQKETEANTPQPTGAPIAQPKNLSPLQSIDQKLKINQKVIPATLAGLGIPNLFGHGSLFGAKKSDAVVNLPQLQLPQMAVPTTANASTTKDITDVFTKPLKDAGSYHEGAVNDMMGRLDTLKQAFDNKQISQDEYNNYAAPLAQWTWNAIQAISGASSTAANSIKAGAQKFQNSDLMSFIKQ